MIKYLIHTIFFLFAPLLAWANDSSTDNAKTTSFEEESVTECVTTADNVSDIDFNGTDTSEYEDWDEEGDHTSTKIQSIGNIDSLRQAKVYDLNGRMVTDITKKGIYIINGKKVVIK